MMINPSTLAYPDLEIGESTGYMVIDWRVSDTFVNEYQNKLVVYSFLTISSRRWKNVVAETKRRVLLPLALGKNLQSILRNTNVLIDLTN